MTTQMSGSHKISGRIDSFQGRECLAISKNSKGEQHDWNGRRKLEDALKEVTRNRLGSVL